MPYTTLLVDSFRAVFGELSAIRASENGHQVNWSKS